MGRQFHFFMGEKEEEELKRYLLDSNVKILFEGKNPTPVEITEFPPAFSDRGWFMVYLYKEEWGELVIKDVSTDRKYLDVFFSPVIEFSRTVIREHAKEITPGRIWFQNRYFKGDMILNKCSEMNRFYQALARQIKKILPKHRKPLAEGNTTIYCSDSIKEMLDNGYRIM